MSSINFESEFGHLNKMADSEYGALYGKVGSGIGHSQPQICTSILKVEKK